MNECGALVQGNLQCWNTEVPQLLFQDKSHTDCTDARFRLREAGDRPSEQSVVGSFCARIKHKIMANSHSSRTLKAACNNIMTHVYTALNTGKPLTQYNADSLTAVSLTECDSSCGHSNI